MIKTSQIWICVYYKTSKHIKQNLLDEQGEIDRNITPVADLMYYSQSVTNKPKMSVRIKQLIKMNRCISNIVLYKSIPVKAVSVWGGGKGDC